jgi:RecA/RadA recombinase
MGNNPKLDGLMKAMRKEHGDDSVRPASELLPVVARIPTGIFYLDYATGGGIPIGRTSMVYGKKSAGKSSLLAKVVANAQKMCRKCHGPVIFETENVVRTVFETDLASHKVIEVKKEGVRNIAVDCVNKCRVVKEGSTKKVFPGRKIVVWIDAEGTYSPAFYEYFGVDNEDIYLITSEDGEQAVDIADASIRTGEVDVLLVDSIAHLVPKKEREKKAEDVLVAVQARLINRAMRLWTASLNELEAKGLGGDCSIFLVNQIRTMIGQNYTADTLPGGLGQAFATSLDIKLKQKEFRFDLTGRPIWMETEFAIEKNKCGVAKMEGHYKMCVTEHPGRKPGDTWDDEAVADAAQQNGFVVKQGGKFIVLDKTFDTEEDFKRELFQRGDFYEVLRSRVLDLMIGRPSDGQLAKKNERFK